MHRLLVLSGLAAAMVTLPGLVTASNAGSSLQDIGSVIAGRGDGERSGDYWSDSRRAAARDLSVLVLPGRGFPAATS